jgi:hypothetical protein
MKLAFISLLASLAILSLAAPVTETLENLHAVSARNSVAVDDAEDLDVSLDSKAIVVPFDFDKFVTFNGFQLVAVPFSGQPAAANTLAACQAAGMFPACDHPSWYDAKCINTGQPHHLSHQGQVLSYGNDELTNFMPGKFMYTGPHGHGAILNDGNGHRWATGNDQGGLTVCVRKNPVNFNGWNITSVQINGVANAANIRAACNGAGLVPVCDHPSYYDRNCIWVGQPHHIGYPPQNRGYNNPALSAMSLRHFVYTGPHGSGALYNYDDTHRWADGNDQNGKTLCTSSPSNAITYNGFELVSVKFSGQASASTILAACQSAGMFAVCDHPSWRDGVCIYVGEPHHLSHQGQVNGYGNPALSGFMPGKFVYTGPHGHGAIYNDGGSHRWAQGGDTDAQTVCTKGTTIYNQWQIAAVKFSGQPTAANLNSVCRAAGMLPVCDHPSYNDQNCIWVGQPHHLSYPPQVGGYGSPGLIGITTNKFIYTGPHGSGSLYNDGGSHRWRTDSDNNGITLCAESAPVVFNKWIMTSLKVSGVISASSIESTCVSAGLKPVCDHPSYSDGKCVNVGQPHHLSYPPQVNSYGSPALTILTNYKFIYTGPHGHGALYNDANSHRWVNPGSESNGLTLCAIKVQSCEVSAWGHWSPCSKACGSGVQSRTRTVTKEGDSCPSLRQERACNTDACHVNTGDFGRALLASLEANMNKLTATNNNLKADAERTTVQAAATKELLVEASTDMATKKNNMEAGLAASSVAVQKCTEETNKLNEAEGAKTAAINTARDVTVIDREINIINQLKGLLNQVQCIFDLCELPHIPFS